MLCLSFLLRGMMVLLMLMRMMVKKTPVNSDHSLPFSWVSLENHITLILPKAFGSGSRELGGEEEDE